MKRLVEKIHSCAQLMALVEEIGFLPLLYSGIDGFSADDIVDEECRYVVLPDGKWDWPLWKWKGEMVTDGNCVYGKFFNKKAGFIHKKWWPDFLNYRRAVHPYPTEGSIEEAILFTLQEHGSLITKELRGACGFTGRNMRGKFDAYITRLQMGCYIVTEDFIYPLDKNHQEYGWGWSLLTTPEHLYGKDFCYCNLAPEESFHRMMQHLREILPDADDNQLRRLIK